MGNNEQKQEAAQVDLLDVLLDKDNKDPITLMDEKGKQLSFEQIAMIVHEVKKEKKLFAILKPVDKIEGIGENEAIVFLVDQDKNGNTILKIEEDEDVAIDVFDDYYDLLEEEMAKQKEKKTAKKAAAPKAAATKTAKTTKAAGKTAGKAEAKPAAKKTTKK